MNETTGNETIENDRNCRKCEMTENGEWQKIWNDWQLSMIHNDEWNAMGKYRQWWMTDSGEWHLMWHSIRYEMTNNGEWHTMGKDTQWWMTVNMEWQKMPYEMRGMADNRKWQAVVNDNGDWRHWEISGTMK